MRSGYVYTIVFLFILSFTFSVVTPKKADSGQHRQITGTVTGIDIRNRTITVEKKNKNVTLDINENTTLTQCINNSSLTDIKIGDKVTVKYKENPDKNSAKSVTIKAVAKNTD
ncbi:hypothetical protein EP227_07565 [bacterium]|nr:MAG: hypothetical protein EP227_07565 [bacterium]